MEQDSTEAPLPGATTAPLEKKSSRSSRKVSVLPSFQPLMTPLHSAMKKKSYMKLGAVTVEEAMHNNPRVLKKLSLGGFEDDDCASSVSGDVESSADNIYPNQSLARRIAALEQRLIAIENAQQQQHSELMSFLRSHATPHGGDSGTPFSFSHVPTFEKVAQETSDMFSSTLPQEQVKHNPLGHFTNSATMRHHTIHRAVKAAPSIMPDGDRRQQLLPPRHQQNEKEGEAVQKDDDETEVADINLRSTDDLSQSQRKRKKVVKGSDADSDEVPACVRRLFPRRTFLQNSSLVVAMDITYLIVALMSAAFAMMGVHPNNNLMNYDENRLPPTVFIVWWASTFAFSLVWTWLRPAVIQKRGDWELVDSTGKLWKMYSQSWLWYDVLCLAPLEFLFIGWLNPVFHIAACHHLLRCPRCLALGRSQNPLRSERGHYWFMTFCGSLVLLYFTVVLVFWRVQEEYTIWDSIYWTVVTMTGVGYGDIHLSEDGRIVATVVCCLGTFAVATLTAVATSHLAQKDVLQAEIERRRKMMDSMLAHYQIPWHVQKEIIGMFPAVLEANSESQFKAMLEGLPDFVANKIQCYLRAKLLAGVPLFMELSDPNAVVKLSEKLEQRFVPPFSMIISIGEVGSEMFILSKGIVEVLVPVSDDEEGVVATLRSGSYFGEIALIEDTVRTASVQAMTVCELLVLAKSDFDIVVADVPQLQQRLQREVDQRMAATTKVTRGATEVFRRSTQMAARSPLSNPLKLGPAASPSVPSATRGNHETDDVSVIDNFSLE